MQFVPRQNWSGYGLKSARTDWATVANAISKFEPVLMVVDPQDRQIAKKLLNFEILTLALNCMCFTNPTLRDYHPSDLLPVCQWNLSVLIHQGTN